MKQSSLLKRILSAKRTETHRARKAVSQQILMERLAGAPPVRPFRESIIRRRAYQIHLIAELKKASPLKGVLRAKFDPAALAKEFEASGASALSVLTDTRFFQGSVENLQQARSACGLPVLRKDFLVDEYQIYESRLMGADAILLIVRLLPQAKLKEMLSLAKNLSLAAITETHTAVEVKRALDAGADIIGVNTRDLDTFKTRFETAAEVRPKIPAGVISICESGVESPRQIETLRDLRYDAVLIGEALMRARQPRALIQELLHG